MAIRTLRFDTDELLKKVSKPIEVIDDKIKILAHDMIDTMYHYDGIGLAAVQVGYLKRMIVIDVSYIQEEKIKKPQIIINPVITHKSKNIITTEEGCLSYPDTFGCVDRSEKITVEGLDLDGNKIKITAKEIEAVVLQHEIDHLDGIVFLDKAYDVYKYDPNAQDVDSNKKGNKNKKNKGKGKNNKQSKHEII